MARSIGKFVNRIMALLYAVNGLFAELPGEDRWLSFFICQVVFSATYDRRCSTADQVIASVSGYKASRTVRRYLQELVKAGYLSTVRHQGVIYYKTTPKLTTLEMEYLKLGRRHFSPTRVERSTTEKV